MTTELGFGELELPSGKLVGLVDVPGHAHYLRAMVQGATGVDVALLAVSAVEGVMPQTREHVRVLELLGVTRMVVALTMRDLADHEIAALAELDVEAFLDGTVFAGASIVPVSSKTGEGLTSCLRRSITRFVRAGRSIWRRPLARAPRPVFPSTVALAFAAPEPS